MFKKTCLYLPLCAVVPSAFAGDIIQWTDTSVTGLYGDDYKLAPAAEQTTITLESAGGWTYGDCVITSYSIHYTKLYDATQGAGVVAVLLVPTAEALVAADVFKRHGALLDDAGLARALVLRSE